MKQIIGLLSVIALITFGNTTIFAQGQPQWVLEKKAEKESYKKDKQDGKDYYKYMTKEEIEAHKAKHQRHNKEYHKDGQLHGKQAKDVREIRERGKYQRENRGEYNGERGRKCGNENGGTRTDNRTGTSPDGKVIVNRRGNTTIPTPTTPTTKPTTTPTTKPTTQPRVIVKPQPTTTPTETKPTDGGLKGRRTLN
ncbi:MAG: hypothetical protein R3E32_10090 [Chitinophagales bacterium]